jgi:hypothetical protein
VPYLRLAAPTLASLSPEPSLDVLLTMLPPPAMRWAALAARRRLAARGEALSSSDNAYTHEVLALASLSSEPLSKALLLVSPPLDVRLAARLVGLAATAVRYLTLGEVS